MKLKRVVVSWVALASFLIAGVGTHARIAHAESAAEPVITLISLDPRLSNASTITTDGVYLYIGVGPSIVSVPMTGGSVMNLYEKASPCCVIGLTRVGSDLFWIDPDGDPDATAIFRGIASGGPIEKVYSGLAAGQAIVDGADITSDGSRLYTTDQVAGAVHAMLADGASLTPLATRFGSLDSEHPSTIASSGGHLYIADSGSRPDVTPAEVLTMPVTGGPFISLHAGPPFVRLTDIEVASDRLYVADQGANTIWMVPAKGGTPTMLASGFPFVQIHGLAYWNNALYVTDTGNNGISQGPGAIYRIDLPNVSPFAANDAYSVDANGTIAVPAPGVLGNDVDGAGETLTSALIDGPSADAGTVTLNHDGSFVFAAAAGFAGDATFRYHASDGKETSDVATVTIKVKHAPTVNWTNPSDIVYGTPLGSAQLTASADVDGTFSYTPGAGTILDAGSGQTLSVLFTPADALNYSPMIHSVAINVTKAPTTAFVTLSKSPQQYSDLETFKATISSSTAGPAIAESVTFAVGTQVMGTAPLMWTGTGYEGTLPDVPLLEPYPPTGQMQPTPLGRTVRATFNNVSENYAVASPTKTLMIGKEDARVTFTGSQMAFTPTVGDSVANVQLSTIAKDISATSEAGTDTNGGDIRHAPVIFFNRDTGMAISPALTVALSDPNNKSIGTATYAWPASVGTANAQTFRVGILIDKYFVRYNSADDILVTVAKPLTSKFISGGGHLVLSSSAGLKAGDPLSRNDVGFAVSYKGSGSNPAGYFNTLVRSNGVYQIKGTVTSLTVGSNTAKLSGTASIYNVTNGSTLVDGRARFEASITDAGEAGGDKIAVTVRDGTGAVWFSSNWNGNATVEQLLAVGSVTVR
jgi:hypothetical protein